MSLFGLDRVLGRMNAFLSLRKASITYPTAATIKRMLKSNPNKTTKNEIGVVEKEVLNSKKFGTLRLFSHVVSQRPLPKGGRGVALHYLAIEAGE